MHVTRAVPAAALLLLCSLSARADESAPTKAETSNAAKKNDGSMSCCAGEEAALCPKSEPAKAASKKKPAVKGADAKSPATPKPAGTGAAPVPNASMIVSKDPVTGQLRPPTAEEVRALNALRPQAAPVEPLVVVLPNGARMIRIQPENASYAVARRNPDGTLTQMCVEGREAASAAQQSPDPACAPRKEER